MEHSRNLNQGLHSEETQQANHNDLINENTLESASQQDAFNSTTTIMKQRAKQIKSAKAHIRSRWKLNLYISFCLFMAHLFPLLSIYNLLSSNIEDQTENSFLFSFFCNVLSNLTFCCILYNLYKSMIRIPRIPIEDYDPSVIPMLHRLVTLQRFLQVFLLNNNTHIDTEVTRILSIEAFIHREKIKVDAEDFDVNQQTQDLQASQSSTLESQNSRETELQSEERNRAIGTSEESESDTIYESESQNSRETELQNEERNRTIGTSEESESHDDIYYDSYESLLSSGPGLRL